MAEQLPTFVVTYHYVPEMEQRRVPHRQAHLEWVRTLAGQGVVIFAGATIDPVDTGMLFFRAEDAYAVRRLLVDDPYAKANLIVATTVRRVGVVIGG